MTNKARWLSVLGGVLAAGILAGSLLQAEGDDTQQECKVRVARLVYAGGKTSKCFADGFLEMADRRLESNISRNLEKVELASDEIFAFPFIIMTGEGRFSLSEKDRNQLQAYLKGGGFLLASAGCSNRKWATSFKAVMADLYPEQEMQKLDLDHPLFHTLVDIDRIVASKGSQVGAVYGMNLEDRLAVVFSPLGLNDTANAGGGCCCCGGNEVRNSKQINANIVAYALTH